MPLAGMVEELKVSSHLQKVPESTQNGLKRAPNPFLRDTFGL